MIGELSGEYVAFVLGGHCRAQPPLILRFRHASTPLAITELRSGAYVTDPGFAASAQSRHAWSMTAVLVESWAAPVLIQNWFVTAVGGPVVVSEPSPLPAGCDCFRRIWAD
jgi:hypothetical protein